VISELRIADLGVIEDASMVLDPGLTVVTGETGAGKTMIVSGLELLLGVRADPKAVRVGADRARVEGRFTGRGHGDPGPLSLTDQVGELGGVFEDNELLVARHVTSTGRSRAYVGGAQVTANGCAEIVQHLVTIHGQSEQLRLADRNRQREMLDRFAGPEQAARLEAYRLRYAEHRDARSELARLTDQERERAREIDLLTFGLREIERVAPLAGEDVALAAEARRLESADDLAASARATTAALAGGDDEAGGALAAISVARMSAERLAEADPAARPLADRVAEAGYLLADVTGDVARYLEELEVEPGRLEQIAERRYRLSSLTRKYGSTADEVLAWAAASAERLVTLESADERILELAGRIDQLQAALAAEAAEIGLARRRAAQQIEQRIGPELAALALPQARLAFEITEIAPTPEGADQVDLVFSANAGTPLRSLGRAASGGELSRVRLALEVVLADGRDSGTVVFDEVDAGVGGTVAVEVGRRLAELARHAQVVVVTHLAQVAAFADRHFVVVKSDDGQVTTSGVRAVADQDRAAELARMMAGLETTESALAHAGELLELAGRTP
jgi:DNA repair protein RecN (Recombination protein N)